MLHNHDSSCCKPSSLKRKRLLFQAQSFITLHGAGGDVFWGSSNFNLTKGNQRKHSFNQEQKGQRQPPAVKCKNAVKTFTGTDNWMKDWIAPVCR